MLLKCKEFIKVYIRSFLRFCTIVNSLTIFKYTRDMIINVFYKKYQSEL